MYTVNIKKHRRLHYSLDQVMPSTVSPCLHRLYIARNRKRLIDARDNVNATLAVFFDAAIQPILDEPDMAHVTAKAWVVHPLGEFHTMHHDHLKGWIKVKIIFSTKIDTLISKTLANDLFSEQKTECVRAIGTMFDPDLDCAMENEMNRQFLYTVLQASPVDLFTHDMAHIKSTHNDTPPTLTLRHPSANPLFTVATDTDHWRKLEQFCLEKQAGIVSRQAYKDIMTHRVDAEGYFKQVFFTNQHVVQIFQKSTASQRVIEIVSLLKLRDQRHMGRIQDIIFDDDHTEVIGLTMDKYDMTLRDYLNAHTYQRLTHYQRLDMIIQMVQSIHTIHQAGIAHRDLSTVNFMVNLPKEDKLLPDGSAKIDLYLIDFGKAVLFLPEEAKRWWVNTDEQYMYKDEVKPSSFEELIVWCKNLPYIMARPDHGYRFYRSIQTLPRSQRDHALLPHLILPAAEDMYSLGTLVWRMFSGMEPWPGVFDTDVKKLRESVSTDYHIDKCLEREIPGSMSKQLLKMFLRVDPHQRRTAADVLVWLNQPGVKKALLEEWQMTVTSRNVTPAASRKGSPEYIMFPFKKQTRKKRLETKSSRTKSKKSIPLKRARSETDESTGILSPDPLVKTLGKKPKDDILSSPPLLPFI
ncbi:kinase-like domain-containing protein [Gilbertella persicaria]|nr:kinase-like domain-containing protein [Gilbertella persicaria]KAI8077296.1 kinase-like domain-containing protein [Gilbertella persicaria]